MKSDKNMYGETPAPSKNNNTYSALQTVVPLIGPLHISLNSREHVINTFHPFFKFIYEKIFPGSTFPVKPKPWENQRTSRNSLWWLDFDKVYNNPSFPAIQRCPVPNSFKLIGQLHPTRPLNLCYLI